jgi:DNA polymerase I-like protein with 3'-5' exonuclease and polymerase domains
MEEVTKEMRALGKRVVHASNYGMGPQTFSDNLAKDDWFVPPKDCKQLLQAYARRFPGLARWQKQIDDQIYKTRTLYNLFGRPKKFLGAIDGALLRSAYSYIPQSTVAELLNKGMIRMYNDPDAPHDLFWNLATVHDSTVYGIALGLPREETVENVCAVLHAQLRHLSHTFLHKGREFTIGLDAKIGFAWGGYTVELDDFSPDSVDAALQKICR